MTPRHLMLETKDEQPHVVLYFSPDHIMVDRAYKFDADTFRCFCEETITDQETMNEISRFLRENRRDYEMLYPEFRKQMECFDMHSLTEEKIFYAWRDVVDSDITFSDNSQFIADLKVFVENNPLESLFGESIITRRC